jgi:hypothetical protein
MTFDNLTYNVRSDGTLTGVTEDQQGNISGQMTIHSPLFGTGSFTGTVTNTAINFVGASRGVYTGTVNAQGILSGTYSYGSQHGTWQATPTQTTHLSTSGKSAGGLPLWLWLLVLALLAVIIGYFVVRRVRRSASEG